MSNKKSEKESVLLDTLILMLLVFIISACAAGSDKSFSSYKIVSDCLARPDQNRFIPLPLYCDFENNPLANFALEGFSNPQIRNNRITLAWGMGIRSDIILPPAENKIKYITFRAKSHPSHGKNWPFQVLLNDVLVLDAKMKFGWEQFSFPVTPDLINSNDNRLSFIYSGIVNTLDEVHESVQRRPAAAFDFVYLSETAFDYKIRYSYKKHCVFNAAGEKRDAFLEPMGSTYWFEQELPKRASLQFGIIIDAQQNPQPFELEFVYNMGGKQYRQSLKLGKELLIDSYLYEGFLPMPFSTSGRKEFGLRISGPGNREYLGKAGLYMLNVVIPD